jgi:hypothetical protein
MSQYDDGNQSGEVLLSSSSSDSSTCRSNDDDSDGALRRRSGGDGGRRVGSYEIDARRGVCEARGCVPDDAAGRVVPHHGRERPPRRPAPQAATGLRQRGRLAGVVRVPPAPGAVLLRGGLRPRRPRPPDRGAPRADPAAGRRGVGERVRDQLSTPRRSRSGSPANCASLRSSTRSWRSTLGGSEKRWPPPGFCAARWRATDPHRRSRLRGRARSVLSSRRFCSEGKPLN